MNLYSPIAPQVAASAPVDNAAKRGPRGRMNFRPRVILPRLSAAEVERQSQITLRAWDHLGPDAARSFLNQYNCVLEGRPLDLATKSADGFDAVEQEIAAHSPRR